MTKKPVREEAIQEFFNYVWGFYGPTGLYGNFFNNSLTQEELRRGIQLRIQNLKTPFDGDSIDREIVRDICLRLRGDDATEHNVSNYIKYE